MPIDRDEFENTSEGALGLESGSHADTILGFLLENSDKAYTQGEIHTETGIDRGSVGATLSRLEDRDLTIHKGKYWAASPEVIEQAKETDSVSKLLKIL